MTDALRPGEMELQDGPPDPTPEPVEPPVPEPVAAAEPEPAADPEPAPAPEPEPVAAAPAPTAKPDEKPKGGMLQELIEERKRAREAEQRLADLSRELAEGRLVRREPIPEPPVADQERAALEATAQELRLVTTDAEGKQVWDLDAAARVKGFVKKVAAETQAPVQQIVLQNKADTNMAAIWKKAAEDGVPPEAMEVVREEFMGVMALPNGAQMLSQASIVDTIFERGLGRAVRSGKYKAAPAAAPTPAPPPVPAPAAGRRQPSTSGIVLSPALQRVYKEHGLDPVKTTVAPKQPDERGYMELDS